MSHFGWKLGVSRMAATVLLALMAVLGANSAQAQGCDADITGDGIVEGNDLGIFLSLWNSDDPMADFNEDGLVDGADLGFLLRNWGPCPSNSFEEYSALIEGVTLTMTTPEGPMPVTGSMELALSIGPPDGSGSRAVIVDVMTFSLGSVTVGGEDMGGTDFRFTNQAPPGVLTSSGVLTLPLDFDMHCWYLDQLYLPYPPICDEADGSEGFIQFERWGGILQGTVIITPQGIQINITINVQPIITYTQKLLQAIGNFIVDLTRKRYPGINDCAAEQKCNKKVVCVQPVFIGTGAADATATGKSYALMKAKSNTVWDKCCVEFNWLAPKYVNKPQYKTIKEKAAGDAWEDHRKLMDEEDKKGENECIEVFFVTHLQNSAGKNNSSGDGLCFGSGTKGAKVIVADDATEACDRKADGVLAHELGHAVGGCKHPENKAAATGTVMEGTGQEPPTCPTVNPDKVHKDQCTKMRDGPLVKPKAPKAPCCKKPDLPA